jgi:hypothetical protein
MLKLNRIALLALGCAVLLAVPAQARNPNANRPNQAKNCTPHAVGYLAKGTLVSHTLTQTQGAGTARKSDDRYSGQLVVNVTFASHNAPRGQRTFTVTNGRVQFADRDRNGTKDQPVAGDPVKVFGKITRLRRGCNQTGFTPQITVRKVQFKRPTTT